MRNFEGDNDIHKENLMRVFAELLVESNELPKEFWSVDPGNHEAAESQAAIAVQDRIEACIDDLEKAAPAEYKEYINRVLSDGAIPIPDKIRYFIRNKLSQ
jgi:hypothetical protein